MSELKAMARIGRPHGIKGEVTVEVLTEHPEEHFTVGAVFATEPSIGDLTIAGARWHQDRLLLKLAEVTTRNRAEEIRNTRLLAEPLDDDDEDAWDASELIGLRVLRAGADIGEVVELMPGAAQDLLVLRLDAGQEEVLVPFVEPIVPEVDLDAGHILITPPPGLLED